MKTKTEIEIELNYLIRNLQEVHSMLEEEHKGFDYTIERKWEKEVDKEIKTFIEFLDLNV